ncbi:MAG: RIP metalloprotease RseP [Thermodesulfovibrionales bacterium]|nr:RIP metalloprotease RseP [Thermodesulfovibrionales bacterium]
MTFLSAVLLIGFLIFIHELGHFIFAKLSGVRVLKFSLGFGPKVIGKKYGDTEYLLSAIPLGGYVKMLGEEPDDQLNEEEKRLSYKMQPIYKRAMIVFAGPLFNFLTAVVIFFFVFLLGIPVLKPIIGEVLENTPAAEAMLQKGDRILEINGKEVKKWTDMTEIIHSSPNKPIQLKISRQDTILTIKIVPETKKTKDIFGEEREIGLIGVKPSGEFFTVREDLITSAKNAIVRSLEVASITLIGIVKLIQRIIPADTIGGPIMIFSLAEKQAEAGALSFFTFAAIISINLAILNLLPIPVLDGGHLLFMFIEALRGKPLNEKVILIAHKLGWVFLLSLMAFAVYNDIFKLISGTPFP